MSKLAEVAIYARLSTEDRDVLKRNSVSINNQIEICKKYILEHDMILRDVFIDDGVTGTIYDRPGFNALIEGIERKMFNTVIVKDLSRLGRNFLKSSFYIEEYFPKHAIRFISINDDYDSFTSQDGEMLIAISNYLNGYYAKECRKKQLLRYESISTKVPFFANSTGCYGYFVNKKQVTIDPYAARIVRKIFRMRIEGISHKSIADYLTSKKILTPREYKRKWKGEEYKLKPWTRDKVMDILFNPVYTGDAYNYARTNKTGSQHRVHYSKRTVVKNTHPPIISRKTFKEAHLNDLDAKARFVHEDYERLNMFFYDERGFFLTPIRSKEYYKVKNGRKFRINHYYRTRDRHYFFGTRNAHEKMHTIALELIHEIKDDSDAFFNKMMSIYQSSHESISKKTSFIKERDRLNEEYQGYFEKNANGEIDDVDFIDKVSSINGRIKEIDEILLKYFDIEYKEKDYKKKLSEYIEKVKAIDETMPRLDLIKLVFKTCKVTKKIGEEASFFPDLNL